MVEITNDFVGGNVVVVGEVKDQYFLKNEIRDTVDDWFYWAFAVKGAEGRKLTFRFTHYDRVGYFGPAVSHDLLNWHWLYPNGYDYQSEAFTYEFDKDEHVVYFAHHFLYHPKRFLDFADRVGIKTFELTKSRKGRSVPAFKLGNGSKQVFLSSRHHACESTGSYVLEGVIEELLRHPIDDLTVFCVPFVDYDGVVDGDQGKNRSPHDHNRDYVRGDEPIYPETRAIRAYVDEFGVNYGFDFHAPWHLSGHNDVAHRVDNKFKKPEFVRFGEILTSELTDEALKYDSNNDLGCGESWNSISAHVCEYLHSCAECIEAFALETPFFGTKNDSVSIENIIELGRCYGRAIRKFISET